MTPCSEITVDGLRARMRESDSIRALLPGAPIDERVIAMLRAACAAVDRPLGTGATAR